MSPEERMALHAHLRIDELQIELDWLLRNGARGRNGKRLMTLFREADERARRKAGVPDDDV